MCLGHLAQLVRPARHCLDPWLSGRALGLHPIGQRFESSRVHKSKQARHSVYIRGVGGSTPSVATLHKNVLRICLEKQNLVYYEACLSDIDAYKREKYLKTRLGKNFIKKRLNNWFRIHASARTNAVQG